MCLTSMSWMRVLSDVGIATSLQSQGQKEFNGGATIFPRIKLSREWNYYIINYIGYLIKNTNAI